jgi:hypothetical protein
MAGRQAYIIAHPNGEDVERVVKGGKAPEFALWWDRGNGWELSGAYSYGDRARANRAAEQKSRTHGGKFKATRVLPAG